LFNYNFNKHNFNDLVFSAFNVVSLKFLLLKSFELNIINKKENNCNKLLVHKFPLTISGHFKTSKCFNCRICQYIFSYSSFKLINLKFFINITLFLRISQHLNHIKKIILLKNTMIKKFIIFKDKLKNPVIHKSKEMDLVNFPDIHYFNCIILFLQKNNI